MKNPKAVALFSGGLDSTLAILVMLHHGVEVDALKFLMHFGCDVSDLSSCGSDPYPAAEKFGFNVKLCNLGWKFVEILKNPKHGHGKNMNPCIDCRLLMLQEAKEYMKTVGADFVITGEVLGQRPMSQMRPTLNLIDKECGLEGRLVRPLSGKLLPSTKPETDGLIKRDWLLDFNGRSRKAQMNLAKQFGLESYTSPAGGCFLTDKRYSDKLRDLFKYTDDFDFNDLNLLNIGRQFRLSKRCKLIVGRNENENDKISALMQSNDIILEVKNVGSPIGLLRGSPEQDEIKISASITTRYSDDKYKDIVRVNILHDTGSYDTDVKPADNTTLDKYRI